MIRWTFRLIRKFGTLILAAWLLCLGWVHLGPQKVELGSLRHQLADKAIVKITEDIRQNRGELRDVVLLQFAYDESDYITDQLRDTIQQAGILVLRDRTLWEKLRKKLNLRISSPGNGSEAAAAAKSAGAQGALFGRVVKFESSPDTAYLDLEYELVDAQTRAIVHKGEYSYDGTDSPLPEIVQEVVDNNPWIFKGLTWLLLALLLPVFTIQFVRTMVAKRSNRVNAFVLGIYTAADGLLAALLIGASFASAWGIAGFLLLLAGAFFYNARIMNFALSLEAAD